MNSVQTVTLNSVLSQNWVGCTVRTPRTQVARTLRAQCPCRGRCCAHSRLVARAASAGRAHAGSALVATRPSSLPQVATPTEQARSQPQEQQARSRRQSMSRPPGRLSLCRDISFMSRHQSPTGQVATSVPCRDLLETNLCRDVKMMSRPPALVPMSRRQNDVTTSCTCAHVATSK